MAHEYTVAGGIAGRIPGAYGPGELDGRWEWAPVRRPNDIPDALLPRLGSEDDPRKVVLAVLSPLREALEGRELGALLAKLPGDLARELADAELSLNRRMSSPRRAGEYLLEVSHAILHPPERTASYVRAVFAAARAVLDAGDTEAIAARLPSEIAALWRGAT